MKKHIKIYLEYHDYPDPVICEVCSMVAVDIHHIEPRGMGGSKTKDNIENLIALCRKCHDKAESKKLSKEFLLSKRHL